MFLNSQVLSLLFALNPENIQGNAISFLEHSEVLIINIPPKLRGNSKEDFVGKIGPLFPSLKNLRLRKFFSLVQHQFMQMKML